MQPAPVEKKKKKKGSKSSSSSDNALKKYAKEDAKEFKKCGKSFAKALVCYIGCPVILCIIIIIIVAVVSGGSSVDDDVASQTTTGNSVTCNDVYDLCDIPYSPSCTVDCDCQG